MSQSSWTETDLAYFAGIIDGEGCFCLHISGMRDVFSCNLSVGNTNPRLVHWLHERFGGKIQRRHLSKNCKPFYQWRLASRDLDIVVAAVLPHLVLKKEQAELMLAYRKTIVPRGRGQRNRDVPVMESAVVEHRHSLRAQMTVLNKRGAA